VDDRLDQGNMERPERVAFVECQAGLMNRAYWGEPPRDPTLEERMLVELIQRDVEKNSGLQTYLRNMLAVMAFDAERQGRPVSQAELTEYSRWLATSVTEALHYFIGHNSPSPRSEARYLAVTAAHITHMLRDTFEDVAAGYYNIPREYLESHTIAPQDAESEAYRTWVKSRVQLARAYFKAGQGYLAQVEHPRCRLAGYAYITRFEGVLDAIEREGYRLRPAYQERKSLRAVTQMIGSAFESALSHRPPRLAPRAIPIRHRPQREL
jgi:phytoene/squalene synthetase